MHVRDEHEPDRLKALHALRSAPWQRVSALDHIAKVAVDHFKVPIALVSLVDEAEQCFVGRQGWTVSGTPRNQAFCRYSILSDEVMVVDDAIQDARFANSPLVTDDPFIRFYAGAPLVLRDDIRLGTVCIMDTKPRTLNIGQKVVLKQLAKIALAELKQLA